MLYKINGGSLEKLPPQRIGEAQVMVVSSQFTERRLEFTDQWHEMPDEFFIEMLKNPDTRFESHVDFDLICVPSFLAESANPLEFPMYMMMDSRQLILLVQDGQEFEGFLETVHNTGRELTTGNLVYRILESLVEREEKRVEEMEQEVGEREELEDVDMDSDDYIRDIVRFRRHLLLLKHLYEHLKRTMEYIVDNDNQLFDSRTLKRFAILEDRSLGMVEDIQVLREEVMQLKEGYQAQRDLKMNRTMQFLTVVTTIFMPLTLLAGWYGMNLQMPEYKAPYAYPVLIAVSILIIGGGVWLCKKKKWL